MESGTRIRQGKSAVHHTQDHRFGVTLYQFIQALDKEIHEFHLLRWVNNHEQGPDIKSK